MRRYAPLLLSMLLAACAVTPRPAVVAGIPIDPQRITDWSASGRMAIAVAEQGGSGDASGQIAVADQANTRAELAHFSN